MCYDKTPARVVATEMRRDEIVDMNDDDIIELYIAPNGEKGDTYFFGTNPLGVRGDALVGSGRETRDAFFQARTAQVI